MRWQNARLEIGLSYRIVSYRTAGYACKSGGPGSSPSRLMFPNLALAPSMSGPHLNRRILSSSAFLHLSTPSLASLRPILPFQQCVWHSLVDSIKRQGRSTRPDTDPINRKVSCPKPHNRTRVGGRAVSRHLYSGMAGVQRTIVNTVQTHTWFLRPQKLHHDTSEGRSCHEPTTPRNVFLHCHPGLEKMTRRISCAKLHATSNLLVHLVPVDIITIIDAP